MASTPSNRAEVIDHPYNPPESTLPLLAGILAAMHFTHRNMVQLVADLPHEALVWKPGPEMSSLAGIVRHTIYCERYAMLTAAGADMQYDAATAVKHWEATDDADALVQHIAEADTLIKDALPSMSVADLGKRYPAWGGPSEESAGSLIAEAQMHTAMHWGHMQMTRQLWEAAHSEFVGSYTRW